MRTGGRGIHADQRQVRLPQPGGLGDQPFQKSGEHAGVPPDAEAAVDGVGQGPNSSGISRL